MGGGAVAAVRRYLEVFNFFEIIPPLLFAVTRRKLPARSFAIGHRGEKPAAQWKKKFYYYIITSSSSSSFFLLLLLLFSSFLFFPFLSFPFLFHSTRLTCSPSQETKSWLNEWHSQQESPPSTTLHGPLKLYARSLPSGIVTKNTPAYREKS